MAGHCQYEVRQARRAYAQALARRRRGISALALIIGFALVVSCLALAIDVGLVVQRHQQLKTASEAASLAGALRLFGGLDVTIEHELQVAEARWLALGYAAHNSFNEYPLQLSANGDNDPRGDVVAGHVDPLTLGSPFIPSSKRRQDGYEFTLSEPVSFGGEHPSGHRDQEAQPLNAILVRTRHSQAGGRGPILFFGALVGVPSHDIYTESIAAVERRITGYRPVGCTAVPMLPLICLTQRWEPEDLRLDAQGPGNGQGTEHGQGHGEGDEHHDGRHNDQEHKLDKFRYDPLTRVVEEEADGVPEIELVLKTKEDNDNNGQGQGTNGPGNNGQNNELKPSRKFKLGQPIDAEIVQFADPEADEEPAAAAAASPIEQVIAGLTAADLVRLSGQVTIDSRLITSGNRNLEDLNVELEELHATLEDIIGQPRLLLLGSIQRAKKPKAKSVSGGPSAVVEQFAAGVVVHSLLGEKSITIRIQPIVLNSCTALPDRDRQPNPWIGKVVLVR